MKVLLIDYQMGNLGSVRRAIEECGADVLCSTDPHDIKAVSRIILPGVGSFREGMQHLSKSGWIREIREAAIEDGIPFLGICLGMQLLSSKGWEGGETEGLGLIPGTVKKLVSHSPETRIPHVGWNELIISQQNPLLFGIPDRSDFYFVHSYHFATDDPGNIIATTPYCGEFVSVVACNNIFGTQFHPEKSSKAGFRLIQNFLSF